MRLSNFIIDIGRPVAYYPSLKKLTNSTTASILLCQFLYWSDKTNDGWFWKRAEQLEEETGLTYEEQKTARERLVTLKLVEEKYDRLNHQMWFKVNQETMNDAWESLGGEPTKPIVKETITKVKENPVTKEVNILPVTPEPTKEIKRPEDVVPKTKKEYVDMIKDMQNWPVTNNEKLKDEIRGKISVRLRVNPDNRKWEDFIEYAANRQKVDNQSIDKFISWAITEGFNAVYWTPEKMKTLWPQAFTSKPALDTKDAFVVKLPDKLAEYKEEEYLSMPSGFGRKKT